VISEAAVEAIDALSSALEALDGDFEKRDIVVFGKG
jgi:hypothetical protein